MVRSVRNYEATVVWEKFLIAYFHVKIVHGKTFLPLGISDEKFLTTNYFKVKLFCVAHKLMHNYTQTCIALMCILHKHKHITTVDYNFEQYIYRDASY